MCMCVAPSPSPLRTICGYVSVCSSTSESPPTNVVGKTVCGPWTRKVVSHSDDSPLFVMMWHYDVTLCMMMSHHDVTLQVWGSDSDDSPQPKKKFNITSRLTREEEGGRKGGRERERARARRRENRYVCVYTHTHTHTHAHTHTHTHKKRKLTLVIQV
jgi:hypothetical protein